MPSLVAFSIRCLDNKAATATNTTKLNSRITQVMRTITSTITRTVCGDHLVIIFLTYVARCDKYLCPDTLACVHFPHHCPCAWEAQQEKSELAEGQRICASRGGFRDRETTRT